MNRLSKAIAYCKRIRNKEKKRYAYGYTAYLFTNGREPTSANCTYMAQQAVRRDLDEIKEGER